MAALEKRESASGKVTYRAKVRLSGFPPQTATFERLTDARKWIQDTESAIRDGRYFKTAKAKRHSAVEMITRYRKDILAHKTNSTENQKHYLEWWEGELKAYSVADVTSDIIAKARTKLIGKKNQFGRTIGTTTANRYLSSHANLIRHYKKTSPTVREALKHLGPAGSENNNRICKAEITLAAKPIMRKSPYAGMLFNGAGRPMRIDGFAHTLPASMGGNKTPIVDERVLADKNAENWIENYHRHLMEGGEPYYWKDVPEFLRRLTVDEALAIQTFPHDFILKGTKSAWFRMIGNAVPCELAFAVGSLVKDCLKGKSNTLQKKQIVDKFGQLELAHA
jgi:site-specific DNA-cytosine methylase